MLWSCCSGERMFSVCYQQDLAKALFIRFLFMQRVLKVLCNGRPSLLSHLCKKGGSLDNTWLLPHAKMLLLPMKCFLCRVDYALVQENVLTKQMWIFATYKHISYWEVVTRILIFSGRHDLPRGFSLWCKSIFFFGLFRNVKLFIVAD